jgi:hypothetical protein
MIYQRNVCIRNYGLIFYSYFSLYCNRIIQAAELDSMEEWDDNVAIAIDGPDIVTINMLFQILIRITNLTKSTKRFSLGIDDKSSTNQ